VGGPATSPGGPCQVRTAPRARPVVRTDRPDHPGTVSMAESMVSKRSRTSSHRRAVSSARRAPATADSRSASSAAGSTVAAAARTAFTSSSDIAWRGSALVARRRASDAALVDAHPHRTACESAARSAMCWLRMAGSFTPARRSRACQPLMSLTDRRASGTRAIGSCLIERTRLCWSRAEDAAQVGRFCAIHALSASSTFRPPGALRLPARSRSLATRLASRLPPCTVRDV